MIMKCFVLGLVTAIGVVSTVRTSHRRCSVEQGVLKNFANFTGKYLCWSLFLINLQACRPATLLKRDFNTGVFL